MIKLFLIITFLVYPFSIKGFCQQQDDIDEGFEYKTVIKTVDGINFEVPEDRPIERRDGIIAPMALDKYVALKIHRLEKRLNKIENSIRKIEEDLVLIKEGMKSSEEPAGQITPP